MITVASGDSDLIRIRLIVRLLMEVAALLSEITARFRKRSKKAGKRSPASAEAELADLMRQISALKELVR